MTASDYVEWVPKGPFLVREDVEEQFGERPLGLTVKLQWSEERWPEKKRLALLKDDDGFPVMFWREWDDLKTGHSLDGSSNGWANWAPRGCFIWRSKVKGEPLYFVHVNRDGQHFPNSQRAIIGCGFWLLLPLVFGLAAGAGGVIFGFFLGAVIPLLLRFLVWDRHGWSADLPLNVVFAPWGSLEGFELTDSERLSLDSNLQIAGHLVARQYPRTIVLASFGRDAPQMRVLDGTWSGERAREYLRLLLVKFLDSRSAHWERLGLDGAGRSRHRYPPSRG